MLSFVAAHHSLTMTSSTTQDLIERITKVTDALMHDEWKASIPFLCVPFMDHMAGIPLPGPVMLDICAYLGVNHIPPTAAIGRYHPLAPPSGHR